MVLLHAVVQVLVLPVQYPATNDPANRFRVSRVFVSSHPQWLLSCTIQQSSQESSSCMFVSVLTKHRIEQVPFSIYRSIQVPPTATDLDVRFIQILGTTGSTSPFITKVLANERCKTKLPDPDGFVADLETPL
jgi:hypothetical protein